MPYEYHTYENSELKLIYHEDTAHKDTNHIYMHWHKSPEILLVTEGELSVKCDGEENIYLAGDIAVINSNQIHEIKAFSFMCRYHCLIVDSEIYGEIGNMPSKSRNSDVQKLYLNIVNELKKQKRNYIEAAIGYTKVMLSLLSRELCAEDSLQYHKSNKTQLVKSATQYIYENFQKEISLEEISEALGLSKYYLSHIFKEITGKTVLGFLNNVRCNNAKTMLESGKYNVAQSAYASGFSNLSYFSKTYKTVMGNSPAKDLKSKKYPAQDAEDKLISSFR